MLVFLSPSLFGLPAFASDYSASITTSGSVTLNARIDQTAIDHSDINIITTCRAGYNLTLGTTVNDNNLYLDGDANNNGTNTFISPTNGTSTLKNSPNTWGFFASPSANPVIPTGESVFSPVPTLANEPAILRTSAETASSSDIDDSFSVYYGVNTRSNLASGLYTMSPEDPSASTLQPGRLVYYLTLDSSCINDLAISFNKNLDGEGSDSDPEETITNFPEGSDNIIDSVNNTVTLSSLRPARAGYQFKEWNTEADGTGNYYYPSDVISIGETAETETHGTPLQGFVTLYAIWVEDCASATVCYDDNHADAGTMSNQSLSANTTTNLIASNFSRAGYGFTGWNTRADGTGTQYGPNQNLTMPSTGGVNLYAQWLTSSGTLQNFSSTNIANNMNVGDTLALQDNRDGEVYMVAKLADGNIWITENLRLLPNTATITNRNTNHPTASFVSGAPSSSSSTGQCYNDNATCVNQINYNAHNLDRTLTPAYDGNTNSTYWYSYGVMYNWYTATAGNGTYELTSTSTAGDLCPAGWHLPTGGASGEWGVLASNMSGNNGTAKSASLRSYPNNFLYSGDYNPSKDIPDGVGKQGRFWSTTPVSSNIKNAYRMGYNSTEVTAATSNSWNKWDNFAIRCIYQGGNVPYSDVDVDFEGTGITSITFANDNYSTEIATPENPSISLAQNVAYTATATLTTGYELANWATTAGGTLSSTTTNPTTYTITTDTTLTVTGQLTPIYTVTTTLGEHVSSISFISSDYGTETITPASSSCTTNQDNTYTCTVDLRCGVEYTISGTYESGYSFDTWTTGAGGTLGDASSNVTTYTITSATTLSLTAKEAEDMTYTLIYHAGSGTDAPESETITSQNPSESFAITNLTPIYYGYTFTGWSETADANNDGTTVDYVSGDTITITGTSATNTKTLYPVYQAVATCPANNICYYDNGADVNGGGRDTMANQSSNTTKLIPSNFSRTGYGFAGWTTAENTTPFGPNATIDSSLVSPGLVLFAKWIKSEGDLQSWRGCNAMTENQVIALTDTRDNNVYAVAKLADGNCWTIENLRLDPGLATITAQNTHNPTSDFITESTTDDGSGNPVSLSTDTLCSTDDDSNCINSIQYNTSSINRSLTPNKSASSSSWYSYGIYYNWYTATAGNGVMDTASGASVSGDICPKNWHLPTSTNSGEWATLNRVVNGGVSNADAGLRTYPVNLIWSGDYSSGRTSGYGNGRYWSSTGYDTNNAYRMGHQESGSKGATPSGNYKKWDGFAVRCIRDEVTAEYSDLTVTLPQNAQSITFTHPQYGTETATTQDPVVSLAQDASYTMTANFAPGYELGFWTGGNNTTIADTTANPTTIIITDDSTLTLTTQEIPTYTVTVNLDSGSTSITFMNASYPTQTVTTTGSTVSLRRGVEYTITGTFGTTNDYVFDSWTAGSGSILGSTTQNPTTYVITSASTLFLTSKQKSGQTTLLPGQELNAKMKTLAEGTSTGYDGYSTKIKSLRMADSLPAGFTPSSANTVSIDGSEKPIYIFFDNTDNAGIMYFYTDAKDIYMNSNSSYAFHYNDALTDISAVSNWNTSNVTNMSRMFYYARALTNIDALANWDTSNVTNMSYMLSDAYALTNIDGAINWDTSSVTDMGNMFYEAISLANIDGAINWDTSSVTNMGYMFESTSSITKLNALKNWNTSNVTNMSGIFRHTNGCIRECTQSHLTDISALSSWDTSNVTNMSYMFSYASFLTNIDALANWDTSSVTNMSYMFSYASSLTNIDALTNWDTSSVTSMSSMFSYAFSLTNIDGVRNWNTSSVIYMNSMFYHASSLTNIDALANWNTSNVNDMGGMFYGASSLTDISGINDWNTSNVADMTGMFRYTNSSINGSTINDWDIRNVVATSGDSSYNGNKFYCMFSNSPGSYARYYESCPDETILANHPTFTKRSGTWNSNGTFIPDDTTSSTVTITVSFDSHISNIEFYGTFPGGSSSTTQTISTSGSTISLARGKSYRITATLASGYELALWNPGENGVIPSNRITLNSGEGGNTYFYPTGDTTLTATSQAIPSNVTTTVNMDSNIEKVIFQNNKYGNVSTSTNGSTVTLKQGATYRVTTVTNSGYEVSSYTATGATITNTAGPHTNFTPSGNSTLTITSTTNTPTHTVTVNMDSNVSYVVFTNNDWPFKVAIRNGFTVDLRDNTPYTATAYTKDGYVLSSWTAGANATLSSTTTNPTTYTVTGDSTLSVTSKSIPTYTTTVNLDSGIRTITISNPRYGTQEITSNNTPITLYEGIEYTITAETKDGSEFSSWSTDSSGTLSSTTDNPAVFTISGTSTLSASTQALPAHQVTVNLDQGISSIGFYNADLGTQQVTTTGSTVNLYNNTDYIITASTNTGFNFTTWTTGPNGTLTDATSNPTSYSVTSDTTLSVTTTDNRILINYDGNGLYYNNNPTDTVNQVYYLNNAGTISVLSGTYIVPSSSNPHTFLGWSEDQNATTPTYTDEQDLIDNATYTHSNSPVTLYAIYQTPKTVTVNMDSRTTSVSFYNADHGIQTATLSSPTVTLYTNTEYITTATFSTGYAFRGWSTNANGTLSSTTTNPTTYTITDTATLTVTSNLATQTVTVNLPTNVTSVSFTNSDYGTQTVNVDHGTASLYHGIPYTITATVDSNSRYVFSKWTTSPNGSLTDANTNPTTYTVTGNATLTPNIEKIKHSVTVNFDSGVSSVIFHKSPYLNQTVTTSGDTVNLAEDEAYTVTTRLNNGYVFTSYATAANGTLTSTTDNPTTYTVTNSSTLTITTTAIPTHTVTVNMDSNITSVSFSNQNYVTETVSASGGTVTLRENVLYQVSSTYNTGYTANSWTTTANGTLSNTTQSNNTYTITGDATLSLTSRAEVATTLLPGQFLNAKMKTLAEGKDTSSATESSKIKSLRMADSLPSGFTPSSANTVSTSSSTYPVYIFFDNTNDAGIMCFYTEARDIYMNADSSYAFYRNTALTNIDALANWDTSSVTDMHYMFSGATSLTNIDGASNWNTSSVTDMTYMFYNANALTNIDGASNWDTSNVTNMSGMFHYATSLTNIDGASNWNTSSVTNMSRMFHYATSLTNIDGASNWNTSSVTNMSRMFSSARALTNIDGASNWDTSSVTDMENMFSSARALTNIDGASNWDTSSVTDMSGMFSDATSLTNIDGAANWDTGNVTEMGEYGNSSFGMFSGATSLTNIDGASNWNTSSVTNMIYMFYNATSLTNISALSSWNTGNVTDMSYMFSNASSLTNIDGATNWDTSSVTSMYEMFRATSALTDASGANNWDVRAVTATAGSSSYSSNNFYRMFYSAGGSSSNPTHPTFTTRSGTWNYEGTFIPDGTTPTNNSSSTNSQPSTTPQSSPSSTSPVANLNNSANSAPVSANPNSSAETNPETSTPDSYSAPLGVSTTNSSNDDLASTSDTITETSSTSPLLAAISVVAASTLAGIGAYALIKKQEEAKEEPMNTESNEEDSGESSEKNLGF